MKKIHAINTLLAMGAFALSAQAQDMFAPAATTTAPAATSSSETNFDVLRGNAYAAGSYGNMAAAFVVSDYLAWPHLMGGNKFLYIEPTDKSGTAAVPVGANTLFMNLQNGVGGALGVTTIGIASTDKFGASISIGKNKFYGTVENTATAGTVTTTTTSSETLTYQGDVLGANFSMPLSGNAISASLQWITDTNEMSQKGGNTQDFYDILAQVNFSHFPSAKGLVWSAGLAFDRYNTTTDSTYDSTFVTGTTPTTVTKTQTVIDTSSLSQIRATLSLGYKALSNGNARVLIGLDNTLAYTMWDDITNARKSKSDLVLFIAPNLVGEYAFNENWLAFAGARHAIQAFGYGTTTILQAGVSEKTSIYSYVTKPTTATIGTRFQRKGFAAEAALSDAVFSDGPSTIFQGTNVLATFGAFLYF